MSRAILGWELDGRRAVVARRDGEDWRIARRDTAGCIEPAELGAVLSDLAREVGAGPGAMHAVVAAPGRTAAFRTQREGVHALLDAFTAAFADAEPELLAADGSFRSAAEARRSPLDVSGTGGRAAAALAARFEPDALVVEVGEAWTALVPVAEGRPQTVGWTDLERLERGELLPQGVLRTPPCAVSGPVALPGGTVALSSEPVALVGDVHLWRGALEPGDYDAPTPDGRPATRSFAGERLARLVGADRETLDELGLGMLAAAIAAAQVTTLAAALEALRPRAPEARMVVAAGLGDFVAAEAARACGLPSVRLADRVGRGASRAAAAAGVAQLRESR